MLSYASDYVASQAMLRYHAIPRRGIMRFGYTINLQGDMRVSESAGRHACMHAYTYVTC